MAGDDHAELEFRELGTFVRHQMLGRNDAAHLFPVAGGYWA
jgi:hypothetical protein